MLFVTNLAAAKALPAGSQPYIYIEGRVGPGDGYQRIFRWTSANLSTIVAFDILNAYFVPPNSDPSGASGGFVAEDVEDPVYARRFGMKADYVTNDSAALYAAIIYCNYLGRTLHLPDGLSLITPGSLPDVNCSIYGPATILKAASNAYDSLLHINMTARRRVTLGGLHGYGESLSTLTGYGARIKHAADCIFDVLDTRNFGIGWWLDGSSFNGHISTNTFYLQNVHGCDNGLLLNSGADDQHQTEANHFYVNYAHHFNNAFCHMGSGQYGTAVDENIIEALTVEVLVANAHGFDLQGVAQRNHIKVQALMGGVSGTGKFVLSGGSDNIFDLCRPDVSSLALNSTDILLNASLTNGYGRSTYMVDAVPSNGLGRNGDRAWHVDAVSTEPAEWQKVSGAWVPLYTAP